ncbi:MAG: hypothetical protein NT175_06835 [Bacteroidetes bacterium]|nr:hypothetical protein [Bacteroidota bacterium]
MDQQEKTVEKYLLALSIGEVKFEPQGYKKPPDFSLNSSIGIEVRRLNENFFDGEKSSGLEELSISLHNILKQVLESFDKKFDGHSYYVGIMYKRPFQGNRKSTVRDMTNALESFINGKREVPCELYVNDNITFDIFPSKIVSNRVFRHAISSDDDSGGLVVQMYIQNILHCIQQKKTKIEPCKHLYKDWWLVLVDIMMSWNLEPYEVEEIKTGITDRGGFNKIIILDYFGDNCLLELSS